MPDDLMDLVFTGVDELLAMIKHRQELKKELDDIEDACDEVE